MKRNSSLSSNWWKTSASVSSRVVLIAEKLCLDVSTTRRTNAAGTHAVEVGDDLIEDPEALEASVVDALFGVEVREVGDGSKHHTGLIIIKPEESIEPRKCLATCSGSMLMLTAPLAVTTSTMRPSLIRWLTCTSMAVAMSDITAMKL
ncbi:hypothetical protein EYF80_028199 [Liparis tanakae]|uniref:Uncharacterized protein n=1 Tax=Liparis tanakae TaxID=230148 RepID=A0A4Z2H6P6_9TELE|nr:hypothetical protein EYF80_028199 [Liparis tanakae]